MLHPLVLALLVSYFGVAFTDDPALPSCCECNETTGENCLNYTSCNVPYPSPSFRLWPNRKIKYQPILCAQHTVINQTEFDINGDGILSVRIPNDSCFNKPRPDVEYRMDEYCLDYDVENNVSIVHTCVENFQQPIPLGQKIASLLSAVTLLITVVIYSMKPSAKWSTAAYVISLSVALSLAFITLAGLQFFPNVPDCCACVLFGYCLQYFFLAAFFWMNASCVDLYLRICKPQPQRGNLAIDEMRRAKFIWASLYSWVVPLAICLSTLALQAFDFVTDPQFRPDIGCSTCFFQSWKTKWIYFYGPMTVIIVVNTVLFSITFYSLFKHKLLTNDLRQSRTRLQREIWFLKQYIKLFFVAGLSWSGEMIGFAYIYKTQSESASGFYYLWRVTDMFNCLQGVFMFLILVCNKEVTKYLRRSLLFKKCFFCHHQSTITPSTTVSGTRDEQQLLESNGSKIRPPINRATAVTELQLQESVTKEVHN